MHFDGLPLCSSNYLFNRNLYARLPLYVVWGRMNCFSVGDNYVKKPYIPV